MPVSILRGIWPLNQNKNDTVSINKRINWETAFFVTLVVLEKLNSRKREDAVSFYLRMMEKGMDL